MATLAQSADVLVKSSGLLTGVRGAPSASTTEQPLCEVDALQTGVALASSATGLSHMLVARSYRERAVIYVSGELAAQAFGITACRLAIEAKSFQVVSIWSDPHFLLAACQRPGLAEAIKRLALRNAHMILIPQSAYAAFGFGDIEWLRKTVEGHGGVLEIVPDGGSGRAG